MDRILLIGTNDLIPGNFSDILKGEHYHVTCTGSAEQALKIIESEPLNLIFLNGASEESYATDLLKVIRKIKTAEELPVIALFVKPDEKQIELTLSAGANDFICGPFSDQLSKLKIRSALLSQLKTHELSFRRKAIQDLIDSIPMVTIVVDDNVKILNANFTARNFINKPVSKIFDELGGNAFNCIQALSNNGNCGKTNECQYCIIRSSVNHTIRKGEAIYKKEGKFIIQNNGQSQTLEILVSTSPLTLDKKPVVLLSIDDITQYKKALREMKEARDLFAEQADELTQMTEHLDTANKKLNEEKEKIEAIFDSSNIGISITDPSGRYVMFNSWWTDQLGYSVEEMSTKTNLDVTHPDDVEASRLWFQKIINGETDRYCLDKKFIRKDGTFFWADLSVSAIKDANNNVTNVIGIIRDITWFKEATEALMKSEIALKEAQKIGNTAHWEYDIVSDKLTLSEQAYKIFDINKDDFELTFKNILSLLDNNTKMRFEEKYAESIRNKTEFTFEDSIKSPSGKMKYLVGKARTRYDKHGNPKYTLGTLSDITERKEIELQIEQQNAMLKELVATKDKFFSIISHDLRNSFSAIMNLSGLLVDDFNSYRTEDLKEFVGLISSTSKTTYSLLQNLLEWAKSQQGLISFMPGQINLQALVTDSIGLFDQQTQLKNIEVSNFIPEDFHVHADTEMLKTIIRNLLSNAIKFTPRGGRIEIKAAPGHPMAEISVSDNGVGMDNQTRESLFRITNATSLNGTEGEKGTGLGLLLCKEFITRHNGDIRVESEPGKGSTFIFTIPQQPL